MALPAVLAVIGTTTSLGSTAFQVSQGVQARKRQRAIDRVAEDNLAAAKRRIEIDRFEALKVPLESYQFAEDIQTQREKQNLMALMESGPRALAAGVGKVAAAGIQGTEQRRQQMAKDLFDLEKLQATEAAKRDAALASLDLATVEGAQLASLAAEQQAAAAFTGAAQTLAGAGQSLYEASDLYGQDIYSREVARALDAGDIAEGDRSKYLDYLKSLDKSAIRQGRRENTLVSGFTNPYGYDPATAAGMMLGTAVSGLNFDPETDQGAGMPTYSGPYQAFDFENLPQ